VAHDNGIIYTAAGSFLFAIDAKTGEPIESFGNNGQAAVILDVLHQKDPTIETAISVGYWFTTAPQIYDGVIYLGTTRSESHIAGGYVLAIDGETGESLWHFNTVPQDESDQGWELAGPTWIGGERNGGGIWETPSIDPELNMIYFAVGNPFGDSTKRDGMNLFTDSLIALSLDTGNLEWYYQQVHHDVWDYDSGNQPILFDMEVDGQPVKALAEANKLGIRSFAMNDTNTNPNLVSFPIPSNDDASKSIQCIMSIVKTAIAEGLEERGVDQEAKAVEKKEKAKKITEEK